jgi:hypothetical protein
MNITLNLILPPVFTIDIGPHLQQVGANLVALFDDLQAKLTDLQTTAADEHTQVMTAIQTLQDSLNTALSNSLTADQVTALNASFDTTKAAISGVFEPPAPAVSPPVA